MHYLDNKLFINKLLQQNVWDLEKEEPSMYPVVIKHKHNDLGCYIAESFAEIEDWNGYYAQEWYLGVTGRLVGTMQNGVLVAYLNALSSKNLYGETTVYTTMPFLDKNLLEKVYGIFQNYTGPFTVDYVDDKIVDVFTEHDTTLKLLYPRLYSFEANGTLNRVAYAKIIRSRRQGDSEFVNFYDDKIPRSLIGLQVIPDRPTISFCRRKKLIVAGKDLNDIENYVKFINVKLGG